MRRMCKLVLIGLACGWVLAIVLGLNVRPSSRMRMRLERARQFVDLVVAAPSIDDAHTMMRRANQEMSTWKNPYTLRGRRRR